MTTCELCEGTRIVQSMIMPGVVTVGPCPNCTQAVHQHYEKELAEAMANVCSKND
jgi:hypothetical protein